MSSKRDPQARHARSVRRANTRSSTLDAVRRRSAIAILVMLSAFAAAALYWTHTRDLALPKIPMADLDATAATLIERELDQVRAARRSGQAWGKLGSVLRSCDFRDEARHCFEVAEGLEPNEPRWPYLHALLLIADSPPEAEVMLRRAVQLCGNEPDSPRRRLAKLLAETRRLEEAERELHDLLRTKPDNAPVLLALAHIAQARGEAAKAGALASRCTGDPHTQRGAWTLLAIVHQRAGDTNAARAAIQKAESVPPDVPVADPFDIEAREIRGDPRELSDRAQSLLASRRLADAAPIIQRLVREQPQFAEGWLLLGRMQLLQREPSAAEQSILRHLSLEPQSVNGLFQLGMVLLSQERYADAATVFEQATSLKPDFGPAFYNLGLALVRSGRKQQAITSLREAIRHNPERIDPYLLLADLHFQLGENAPAAELLRQAEALNPEDRRLIGLREKLARK